ncbi:hypothetical protein [Lapidilactobacillus bayanensis]|uniref:hypothetical protein n=1 Tax=Lapidilactobacillus bayanensis TaxID=2485998 RepID=UPI000F7A0C5E|nr:hypothetical protein [Lapidilactobacillus bayanensis]
MASFDRNLAALSLLPKDARNFASFALYAVSAADISKDQVDYHEVGIAPFAQALADPNQAAQLVNTDVMMLGYNMSTRGNDTTIPWSNYHETIKKSNDKYIPATLNGTFAEGAYMSDLFKDLRLTDSGLVHRLFRSTLPHSRLRLRDDELTQVAGLDFAEIFQRSIQLFMAEYQALQPKYILLFGTNTQTDFAKLQQYYPEFAIKVDTQIIKLKHYAPRAENHYSVAHQNRAILNKIRAQRSAGS